MPIHTEMVIPVVTLVLGLLSLSVVPALPRAGHGAAALRFLPTVSRAEVLRDITALDLSIGHIRGNGYLVELDATDLPDRLKTGLASLVSEPEIQLAIRAGTFCIDLPQTKEN
ncbi:hypothetical protein [Roseinatronobacter sp. NSM]|uniref:hypothetical protein n=1 Tax=Roseinatronobacter sp. NSM TaxID=3457785 RepID=UPI004036EBD3